MGTSRLQDNMCWLAPFCTHMQGRERGNGKLSLLGISTELSQGVELLVPIDFSVTSMLLLYKEKFILNVRKLT